MTIWYVRPSGGSYGAEDGTSYDDAWDGFSNIVWGVGGILAGDTLYICGTNREKLSVGTSGSSGNSLKLRGDYSAESGRITGMDLASSWNGPDGNGEYYLASITISPRIVVKDSIVLTEGTEGSLSDDEWDYNAGIDRLYYKPPNGHVPGEYQIEYAQRDLALEINAKSYVDVKNLMFDGSKSTGISDTTGSPSHVIDCDHINIDSCTARWSNIDGIYLHDSDDSSATNCTIYDVGHVGLQAHTNCNNVTFSHNTIYNIGSWSWDTRVSGIDREGITGGGALGEIDGLIIEYNEVYNVGNNTNTNCYGIIIYTCKNSTIRYNKIHDCKKSGIVLQDGAIASNINNKVYCNLIYDTGSSTDGNKTHAGISINNQHGGGCDNTKIYNNVIYNHDGSNCSDDTYRGALLIRKNFDAANDAPIEVKNNIIYTINDYAFRMRTGLNNYTQLNLDYNCYYSISGTMIKWNDDTYIQSQFSTYQSAKSQDPHSISLDPLLTDPSNSNFTLQSSSPCIDVGADLGASYDDALHELSSWPSGVETDDQDNHGPGWDIGAIFYTPALRGGCGVEALGLGI